MPRARLSLRPLAWLGLALAALALAPATARAHPLGNFTINHYSRLDLSGREVRLHLVVDMAEIPAFQEIRRIDADGDGTPSAAEQAAYLAAEVERLRQGLRLTLNGQDAPLRVVGQSIAFPPGQGGLSLLRIEVDFAAALPAGGREVALRYEDGTFPGHLGWREIVVRGGPGVDALQSDAPAESVSDELRRYPQDALASPLDARV
ncbi:MAG: nickel transporter, partial [Thermomicrobiaceae bacterium]|nr:nickel transporter [Thermomicrobiaceae bacterium]